MMYGTGFWINECDLLQELDAMVEHDVDEQVSSSFIVVGNTDQTGAVAHRIYNFEFGRTYATQGTYWWAVVSSAGAVLEFSTEATLSHLKQENWILHYRMISN